jgi:acetyl-CoA carboxylase biotin carboxyl carrier protein
MTKKNTDDDVTFIQALATVLRDNDLTELQVERQYGDEKSLSVHISRATLTPVAPVAAPAPALALVAGTAPAPAAASVADDPANHPGAVSSPMVGTIYMQAEPGATPFASVGATVNEGDTLLIVEAMKTMNHIPAPRSGVITRILIEDGAVVEYGTPLVILE